MAKRRRFSLVPSIGAAIGGEMALPLIGTIIGAAAASSLRFIIFLNFGTHPRHKRERVVREYDSLGEGGTVMRGLRRLSFPWSLCYWWLLPSPQCIDLRPMRRDSCAIIPSSSFPLLPKPFTFASLLLLFIDSGLGHDHDCAFGYYAWTFAYLVMSYLYLCILYGWR